MRTTYLRNVTPLTLFNRQDALRRRYAVSPGMAWTTSIAWTETKAAPLADPCRGSVRLGLAGHERSFAVDDALGGPHDAATPGELLCASLAACMDSTIRMLAASKRLGLDEL